jgi:hypothetical protein
MIAQQLKFSISQIKNYFLLNDSRTPLSFQVALPCKGLWSHKPHAKKDTPQIP